jgi:hypothetical protein
MNEAMNEAVIEQAFRHGAADLLRDIKDALNTDDVGKALTVAEALVKHIGRRVSALEPTPKMGRLETEWRSTQAKLAITQPELQRLRRLAWREYVTAAVSGGSSQEVCLWADRMIEQEELRFGEMR